MIETIHEFLGWSGHVLLVAFALLGLPGLRRAATGTMLGALALSPALACLPWIRGHSLLYYTRGVIGDLSLVTQGVLVLALLRRLGVASELTRPLRRDVGLLLGTLLAGLYCCTLGYWHFHLYGLGYRPNVMLLGLAGLLLYAWIRQPGLALLLVITLVAYRLRLVPSSNLWDALGDPLLCAGSLWRVVVAERRPARVLAAHAVPATPVPGVWVRARRSTVPQIRL